ncbi:DUF1456 family protein [Catenovulum sp. 2E275]|uniref:DUF1456 family protein n=1 Tax=Catenovulum sp. 2E275 TaxID=2980497 RepID=UPI00292A53C5|nr:DUF1456 family protein [Catenovulum sp. 2E275]
MTNNDILRRIRFTFNYNDKKMAEIIASTGFVVKPELIKQWLKKEDDSEYVRCSDREFSHFLNGFINEKRGKREDAEPVKAEDHLNNNIILKKLKIALNLKTEDIVALLKLAEFKVSENEITALFRRASHHHYRECQDQFMRRFLTGMQLKYSGKPMSKEPSGAAAQKSKTDKPKKPVTPIVYGDYANSIKVSKIQKADKPKKTPEKQKRSLSMKNFK